MVDWVEESYRGALRKVYSNGPYIVVSYFIKKLNRRKHTTYRRKQISYRFVCSSCSRSYWLGFDVTASQVLLSLKVGVMCCNCEDKLRFSLIISSKRYGLEAVPE